MSNQFLLGAGLEALLMGFGQVKFYWLKLECWVRMGGLNLLNSTSVGFRTGLDSGCPTAIVYEELIWFIDEIS